MTCHQSHLLHTYTHPLHTCTHTTYTQMVLRVTEIQKVMNERTVFCIPHVGPDDRGAEAAHFFELKHMMDHPAIAPWERHRSLPANQMYAGAAQYAQRETKQQSYLMPYLGFGMYNSHGRFFTQPHVMEAVSKYLNDQNLVSPQDHFIDFSAGSNEFAPLLASKTDCTFQSFDLFPAKVRQNFKIKDWFTVSATDVCLEGRGKEVVLGLNPPYGKANIESCKFVAHGINVFNPRMLVLIVPDLGNMRELENYTVVHKDYRLVGGKDFYIPGAQTMGSKMQTNTDPAFIIYRRKSAPLSSNRQLDTCPSRQSAVPALSHLQYCARPRAAFDPRFQPPQVQANRDRSRDSYASSDKDGTYIQDDGPRTPPEFLPEFAQRAEALKLDINLIMH